MYRPLSCPLFLSIYRLWSQLQSPPQNIGGGGGGWVGEWLTDDGAAAAARATQGDMDRRGRTGGVIS